MKQKLTKLFTDNSTWHWYVLAVLAVALAVPNGMVIKTVTEVVEPLWINVIRFAIVVLVMAPFVVKARAKMTRRNIKYAATAGVFYALACAGYVQAVSMSQVSYVAVIALGIPAMLIAYSAYFTGEKVSRKAVVGISIAALGVFAIVGFPLLMGQGFTSDFHPLATAFAIANTMSFPLMVIFSRKANDEGLPLGATFGVASIAMLAVGLLLALMMAGPLALDVVVSSPRAVFGLLYSALAVSLAARLLTVVSYKNLGSATVGALYYVEKFLAILLPIAILGEHMTSEMMLGGLLILLGVIVAESRQRAPDPKSQEVEAGHRYD